MFISGFASSSIAHVKYWGIVSVHLLSVHLAVRLVSVRLVSVHLLSVNLAVRLVSMVEFIGSMMVVYHMEDWFLIIDMNNPFGYFLN